MEASRKRGSKDNGTLTLATGLVQAIYKSPFMLTILKKLLPDYVRLAVGFVEDLWAVMMA